MALSRRQLLISTVGVAAASCASSQTTADPGDPSAVADPGEAAATTGIPNNGADTTETSIATPQTRPVSAPDYSGEFPFTLGVASGDPDHTSVVLWTRLASDAQTAAPFVDQTVALDVATDDLFDDLALSMLTDALSAHGHSVHAIADGLDSDTWYFYRFRIGEHTSPVGRTRTTPDPNVATQSARFGFSSCQNWESGTYAAHRELAELDLDFFVWLGDYIYEYGPGNNGDVRSAGLRNHDSPEVTDLDGYRQRYALYKSDPDLQAHHAARPWIVTWDDHEVVNNYNGNGFPGSASTTAVRARQASAYQAWWEHMPVRMPPPTPGEDYVIYRSIRWGDLIGLHMLDGRQFRSPQIANGEPIALPGLRAAGVQLLDNDMQNPDQSMLGARQRNWLEAQVQSSTAQWNALGNQVYMHGLNAFPGEVPAINTDSWDGYFGEREALLNNVGGATANLVVLSGDFHASTAADLRTDPFDLDGPVVATEFMAPAISSTFPDSLRDLAPLALLVNPQIRNFSPDNGFMTCDVTHDRWVTHLHVIDDVTSPESASSRSATFTVNAGVAGIASVS